MTAPQRLVVEADGGSRGNPGVAGYGAVVRDAHTGRVLVERAAPLGRQSNNVAEYRGLIAGLEAALAVAPGADLSVRMDSKLVVEQMAGRWKVKHEDMRRLSSEAAALVRQIGAAGGSVSWTWIPREQNKAADKLSNDGMDGRSIDTLPAALAAAAAPVAEATRFDAPERPPPAATRLLLVTPPRTDPSGLARALHTVVDRPVRLATSSLTAVADTAAAIAAALGVAAEVDADWDERTSDLESHVLHAYKKAVVEGGTVVVVTSPRPVLALLGNLLGMPRERLDVLRIDPGSVTAIDVQPDGKVCVPFVNRAENPR